MRLTRMQPWAWCVGILVSSSGRSGLLLAVGRSRRVEYYDIMFAHNVTA